VFVVQYRPRGTRQAKRVTLGAFGPLTIDEARTRARVTLGAIAGGADPGAERRGRQAAPTVREFGGDYLADVAARRKARTATEYSRLWEKHVVPAIGTVRVADVTAAQVAALHRALRSTPYGANRTLALIGAFFGYAERQGVRTRRTNPAADVSPFPERPRERFLTPDEVVRLGAALSQAERVGLPPAPTQRGTPRDGAPATGPTAKHRPRTGRAAGDLAPANPYAIAAIRLLILTGCREGEILSLRWDMVDTERGFLRLSNTKTGASVRPLPATARAVLERLPKLAGSPYVLPGARPDTHLREINRVWYAVRHAAGLPEVRLHDLRHSYASAAASAGTPLLVIRALLGHKDTKTTARYAHLLDAPVQTATDATACQLAGVARGTTQRVD
jgi:integrase